MAKFVQVLVAFFHLSAVAISSLSTKGDFNRCNRVPKVASLEIYSEGEMVKLCCHITNLKECNGNISIFHEPFVNGNGNKTLVLKSEKCSDELLIQEAETSNNGKYTCQFNEDLIGSKDVYVVGKPKAARILNKKIILKAREKTSYVVTFDPGDREPFDKFTLYRQIENGDKEICCKNMSCTKRTCICKCDYGRLVHSRRHTLIVVKTRLIYNNTTKDSFNPYIFIQPKPVVKLKATHITSTSVKISFCDHHLLRDKVSDMNSRNISYGYTFQMFKRQGARQNWAAFILSAHQSNKVNRPACSGADRCSCIVVEVQHLTPYTEYDVRVTAKTVHSKSRPAKITFTTKGDAPQSPPKEILFWAVNNLEDIKKASGNANQKPVVLVLNWKPLPHDEKGGPISYDVEVFGDDSELSHQYNVRRSYTIVQNVPVDKNLVIKVWAVNNISRSNEFSELRIPRFGIDTDHKGLESHVDLQKKRAVAYMQRPLGWKVSGVHWCPGHQYQEMDRLVVCDEFPLIDESVKQSKQTTKALKHTVDLSQRNVTPNDAVWEEIVLIKRYKNQKLEYPKVIENLGVTVKGSNNHTSPTLQEWNGKPLKFFLSFIKDGKHMSQLFPFNCYYDNSKDEVKLLPQNDKRFVEWEQECDFDNPSQYLVEEYNVVFAESKQCQSVTGMKPVMQKNRIFDRNKIEIAQQPLFVCITSKGSRNQTSHKAYPVIKFSDGFDATVIFVIITVIVIMVLIVGCIFYYYKRSKKGPQVIGITLTRMQEDTAENILFTEVDNESQITEYHGKDEKDSGFTASSHLLSRTGSETSRPFSELHRSDSGDNFIGHQASSIRNHDTYENCLDGIYSETTVSQGQGESSTGNDTSNSTSQDSSSGPQLSPMELLTNQLRLKCPE